MENKMETYVNDRFLKFEGILNRELFKARGDILKKADQCLLEVERVLEGEMAEKVNKFRRRTLWRMALAQASWCMELIGGLEKILKEVDTLPDEEFEEVLKGAEEEERYLQTVDKKEHQMLICQKQSIAKEKVDMKNDPPEKRVLARTQPYMDFSDQWYECKMVPMGDTWDVLAPHLIGEEGQDLPLYYFHSTWF